MRNAIIIAAFLIIPASAFAQGASAPDTLGAQTTAMPEPTIGSNPEPSLTTGSSAYGQSGYSNRPQSPISPSSGNVTHSDEQEKGLVPGNTSADGGESRNQGH